MFGRGKDSTQKGTTPDGVVPTASTGSPAGPTPGSTGAAGKGRPTPKRREQEKANQRPLVGSDRKAAAKSSRDAVRAERMKARAAMMAGDEKYFPPRDKGPARRFARDVVDSRRNIGEYFLFFALAIVATTLFQSPEVQLFATAALYLLVLFCVIDGLLLHRRLKRRLIARFGEERSKGAAMYGVLRAFQLRRSRIPRPGVARGETPRDELPTL